MNGKLKDYVEQNVLTLYNDDGRELVNGVFDRCLEIINVLKLDVDINMVYVICAFHDLGHQFSSEFHEEVSSNIFLNNDEMRNFFNENQIKIIADAIVDHRDTLEYEPRSNYGKLISSARKETSISRVLYEVILTQYNKNPKMSVAKIIELSYGDLVSKYGENGYVKAYYQDNKYLNFLMQINDLLNNKKKFINISLQIIDKLDFISTNRKR